MLLPPSESKRGGGDAGAPLELSELSFPSLTRPRRAALAELRRLSSNLTIMSDALRLGAGQRHELLRNREVRTSPTMPALERYTGVLYDAIGVESLEEAARACASRSVIVHSALFGLLGADDSIPAYRLSHDSRLPGRRLRDLWRGSISSELDAIPGVVLDLRSEGYVALGPLPPAANRFFVRVVTETAAGRTRALNHFNKAGKGRLVRAVLESGIEHSDAESLLGWAEASGIRLRADTAGELQLVVDQQGTGSTARQQPTR